MSTRCSSEHEHPRPGQPPPSPNPRASPEECYSQRYNTESLIFPMSLSQSTSTTRQATNPTGVNHRHNPQHSPTEPQSALFSRGNASATEDSMTSARSEGFAQSQPSHHPMIPQQPPQLPLHINPQMGRVLTAADFSRRHPLSPKSSSSSESSGRSNQSSVGSFTNLVPAFLPPTSPTQPIPIPQTSPQPDHPFTPQYHQAQPQRRRPRKRTNHLILGPSD